MQKFFSLLTILSLLSVFSHASRLNIIDDADCKVQPIKVYERYEEDIYGRPIGVGSYFWAEIITECPYQNLTREIKSSPDYMPYYSKITVNRSASCNTSVPIPLNVFTRKSFSSQAASLDINPFQLQQNNADFQARNFTQGIIDLSPRPEFDFSALDGPITDGDIENTDTYYDLRYANSITIFHPRGDSQLTLASLMSRQTPVIIDDNCELSVDVETNLVDIRLLTLNLTDIKANTERELSDIESLYSTTVLLSSTSAMLRLYVAFVDGLGAEDKDLIAGVDALKLTWCSNLKLPHTCTWQDITTNLYGDLFEALKRYGGNGAALISSISGKLDEIQNDTCTSNCTNTLSQETVNAAHALLESLPSTEDFTKTLTELETRRSGILLNIEEYEAVAEQYGISWEDL